MELEEVLRRRRATQPLGTLLGNVPVLAGPATPPFMPTTGDLGPPPPVPVFNPTGVPRPGSPVPTTPPPGSVHIGNQVPTDASNLQRLMAQHATLSQADPASKVNRTGWGYEVQPPEQSPSRLRHAGMGAATGAMLAGQATKGDPWGTLAGAAVGALTGGVSPALMQAFQRRQELDQSTGELATEQQLQLRNAQIGETLAQAEQRRMDPYLEAEKLRQQRENAEMLEGGRNRRAELGARTRVETATEANKTRAQAAAEANKLRRESLEERQRHNKVVENKPGTATEEITVAGRKFKVPAATAARILEARSTGTNKARVESGIEEELETEAANDHLTKRRQAEESASVLRAERDKLSTGVGARRNEARVKELDRQIADAEREASYRQREADDAFQRARKAKAKGGGTQQPASSGGGGRTLEGAVEAFRKKLGREPTAEETERMRRALGQ